uniref:Uncharacterized protein n=1 Tax=Aegilops tauschii subsp. strangulata TaxID=200361 RepID=A0A453AS88_AEGTS
KISVREALKRHMYVMRKSTFVKSKTAKLLVEQVYGQIKHVL